MHRSHTQLFGRRYCPTRIPITRTAAALSSKSQCASHSQTGFRAGTRFPGPQRPQTPQGRQGRRFSSPPFPIPSLARTLLQQNSAPHPGTYRSPRPGTVRTSRPAPPRPQWLALRQVSLGRGVLARGLLTLLRTPHAPQAARTPSPDPPPSPTSSSSGYPTWRRDRRAGDRPPLPELRRRRRPVPGVKCQGMVKGRVPAPAPRGVEEGTKSAPRAAVAAAPDTERTGEGERAAKEACPSSRQGPPSP